MMYFKRDIALYYTIYLLYCINSCIFNFFFVEHAQTMHTHTVNLVNDSATLDYIYNNASISVQLSNDRSFFPLFLF